MNFLIWRFPFKTYRLSKSHFNFLLYQTQHFKAVLSSKGLDPTEFYFIHKQFTDEGGNICFRVSRYWNNHRAVSGHQSTLLARTSFLFSRSAILTQVRPAQVLCQSWGVAKVPYVTSVPLLGDQTSAEICTSLPILISIVQDCSLRVGSGGSPISSSHKCCNQLHKMWWVIVLGCK